MWGLSLFAWYFVGKNQSLVTFSIEFLLGFGLAVFEVQYSQFLIFFFFWLVCPDHCDILTGMLSSAVGLDDP